MQEDYRKLARVFDKPAITNFPSHDVETKENPQDPSGANGHAQSQPLYGMSINSYTSRQPHPPYMGTAHAPAHGQTVQA